MTTRSLLLLAIFLTCSLAGCQSDAPARSVDAPGTTMRGNLAIAHLSARRATRFELVSRPRADDGIAWFADHDEYRIVALRPFPTELWVRGRFALELAINPDWPGMPKEPDEGTRVDPMVRTMVREMSICSAMMALPPKLDRALRPGAGPATSIAAATGRAATQPADRTSLLRLAKQLAATDATVWNGWSGDDVITVELRLTPRGRELLSGLNDH